MEPSPEDRDIVPAPVEGTVAPSSGRQATTDEQLVELWLHGRSRNTQAAYRADAERFTVFTNKPMHAVTLGDVQAFADHLESGDLAPATRHRVLSSIKSLFAFGHRLGYLPFDVARPLRLPALRDQLSQRILDEEQVRRMLILESQPRNEAIITLLYVCGLRVSELCSLRWGDLVERDHGGQVTVFGKGSKTRTLLIPKATWARLLSLRGDGDRHDAPVFRSRQKRGHLTPVQVRRIVRRAARRAGINVNVSPHWMRHAHASHSLDKGAPISLVQRTLGHANVSTTSRYLFARPSDSSSNYLDV